jgi:hypothetical protein
MTVETVCLFANRCVLPHDTAVVILCCMFEVQSIQRETQRITEGIFISKLQKLLNVFAIMICTQVYTTHCVTGRLCQCCFDMPSTVR